MKRVILFAFIAFFVIAFSTNGFSQARKIDDTKEYLANKDYAKAKESIDAALIHEKTKNLVETWYIKGLVYSSIDNDPALKKTYPDARKTALEAFYKAESMNKDDYLKYVLTYNGGGNPVLYIYQAYYQEGAILFTEKKYAEAAQSFKQAFDINEKLAQQPQSGRPLLDTSLVINLALSYEQAGDKKMAAEYYEDVANANLGGENYSGVYRWLCFYYYKTAPDSVKLNKYLYIGKKIYPNDGFYSTLELDRNRSSATGINKETLFESYENALTNNKDDAQIIKSYISDLFAYIHPAGGGKRPENVDDKAKRLEELYAKIIELEPQKKADYSLDLGKHHYNEYLYHSEDVKPINMKINSLEEKLYNYKKNPKNKPVKGQISQEQKNLEGEIAKAKKEKEDIKLNADTWLTLAIQNLEFAYEYYYPKFKKGELKGFEKNLLKSGIDILIICYQDKKNQEKAKFYDDKYSEIK